VSPAVWFAVLSVVLTGGVTTMPLPGAAKVTTIVAEPVNTGDGFTTIVAAVPGPVAVLHVTVTALVAVSTLACALPAQAIRASSPPRACACGFRRSARGFLGSACGFLGSACGFLGIDESMEDLP
jgi:hypothetical protein